ncbi:AGE family epimerase/isomerase [Candidatus Thiosymbion oneisti]|uniref:AGE family epimerase/isomerase n=1 Tax=Candidatus Thiosymbion oneisti TaxID=589554 RepID=UPI000B1ADAA0|nr:AGE family epimerase/isomerase [Candidatus Thiosymbion oneisti]
MALNSCYQDLTVTGSVVGIDLDKPSFSVKARSGDVFEAIVGPTTWYQMLSNLDQLERDRVPEPEGEKSGDGVRDDLKRYMQVNRTVTVNGVIYKDDERQRYEARAVHLFGSEPDTYVYEETHWWLSQLSLMSDRWLDLLFEHRRSYAIDDFSHFYRTSLNITGQPLSEDQECATLSRLIYGLSSAYLLTGQNRYYLAAKAGVAYQRQAFRSLSHDGRHCFWAYGRRRDAAGERLIIPSQNGDDHDTIPLYEQIYALAGLAQYYRITLDWEVLEDIQRTVNTFQDFYWDPESERKDAGFAGTGGYYSHLDFATMRPDSPGLGDNRSQKNWNSVGDHIPAYLINLILALDPIPRGAAKLELGKFLEICQGILDETSRIIAEHFEDPDSDFVNERFTDQWKPIQDWRWQQNRAVVGHDLKIAWNLTRCAFYCQKRAQDRDYSAEERSRLRKQADTFLAFAQRLGDRMAEVGLDKVRGGVFDLVERQPTNDMPTQFAYGCTKDFWQQEQGILAYLILHGATVNDRKYLELARECIGFWNLFFLDRGRQGVYFRTTANGLPVIEGGYAHKGGHSISGYHAFELNFLAHLYTRAFVTTDNEADNNFCVYFKVTNNSDQESINVLPDFFPPDLLEIRKITFNGIDYTDDRKPAARNHYQIRIDDVPRGSDGTLEVVVEFRRRDR